VQSISESTYLTRRGGFFIGMAALALSCASLSAQSQQPAASEQEKPSAATLSVQVRLVNVYVTVRDKKGAIVQSLGKDDFTVEEDGRPQKVGFFSKESNLPLTVGLLVDTSPSESQMIDQEREASREFLDTIVHPKTDKAFVIHFDRQVEMLQGLTSSLVKLEDSLDKLRAMDEDEPQRGRRPSDENLLPAQNDSSGDDREPGGRGRQGAGGGTTHLFDAVYLASEDVLKRQTGRKAIVIVGDGDDMGSKVTRYQAIRAAQRADTSIYCIRIVDESFGKSGGHKRFSLPIGLPGSPGMGGPGMGGPGGGGQGPGGGGPDGGSGGGGPDRKEGKKNTLRDIYGEIERELRSQYSLGYTPEATAKEGFRRIQVSARQKGLSVQARDGYYADAE
jgi:VWFA-related protein